MSAKTESRPVDRFLDAREEANFMLLPERMRNRIVIDGWCWIWLGSRGPNGYGKTKVDGVHAYTHRYAYTLIVGPIPAGLQLDHQCRVRACCNPAHLKPCTPRQNTLAPDSQAPAAINAKKTACPRGHEYDGRYARGDRYCKACKNHRLVTRDRVSR